MKHPIECAEAEKIFLIVHTDHDHWLVRFDLPALPNLPFAANIGQDNVIAFAQLHLRQLVQERQ
jgi:hypothetical protein